MTLGEGIDINVTLVEGFQHVRQRQRSTKKVGTGMLVNMTAGEGNFINVALAKGIQQRPLARAFLST